MKNQKGKSEVVILIVIGVLLLALISGLLLVFAGGYFFNVDGEIVEEIRTPGSFSKVDLRGSGNLHVTQGPETTLRIEANESAIDDIVTEVKGDTLVIEYRKADITIWPFTGSSQRNYYLTVPDLEKMTLSGSGKVTFETFETQDFSLDIIGSGNVTIPIVTRNLKVLISGSGNVDALGTVVSQEVLISGSGNYKAFNLESRDAVVEIDGSGEANVTVLEELEASISGSGNVRYKGDPQVAGSISGSGSVKRVSD